jgi:hypothetical protein
MHKVPNRNYARRLAMIARKFNQARIGLKHYIAHTIQRRLT